MIDSRKARSIAYQAAGHCKFTERIDRWDTLARCKGHDLLAAGAEDRVVSNDKSAGAKLSESRKSRINFILGCGFQDMELDSLQTCSFLNLTHDRLHTRIVWVHEQCDHVSLRHQLGEQLKPFGIQPGNEDIGARQITAGPREAGDQIRLDGISAGLEDYWDRRGCGFCRERRSIAAASHNQIDLAGYEIGDQCRQPVITTLSPLVFYRQVFSLDVTGFPQPLAERGHKQWGINRRPEGEEADNRRPRLLLRSH